MILWFYSLLIFEEFLYIFLVIMLLQCIKLLSFDITGLLLLAADTKRVLLTEMSIVKFTRIIFDIHSSLN